MTESTTTIYTQPISDNKFIIVFSEQRKQIVKALLNAQKDIKHAVKDASNQHLKNDYATLESVIDATKEALLKNNILVIQAPSSEKLITILQHESGEYIEAELDLLLTKKDMQGLGSAITYGRRYSLSALLNISQADDDGNAASKIKKQTTITRPIVTPQEKKASAF